MRDFFFSSTINKEVRKQFKRTENNCLKSGTFPTCYRRTKTAAYDGDPTFTLLLAYTPLPCLDTWAFIAYTFSFKYESLEYFTIADHDLEALNNVTMDLIAQYETVVPKP